ncbi:hypothetical protein [Streptococcus oralis]|uniref:Uncharacterized protein n=1 Tax=Streptococcus oralis subsp. tigurinus TaxID=1077464 RepID=A0A1X1G8S1_STROR|nr:hypothetical protein [Streptococcus oralis]ORO43259.1 hypothetical protein B7727_04065 [Streptococcus oralis subsp. tigurinus]
MGKLKLSLLNKWELDKDYSFILNSVILHDGRALVLTSKKENSNCYSLLEVSPLGVKEIDAWDCDHAWKEEPLVFTDGQNIGIIKAGKEIVYYTGDFSHPEIIAIKDPQSILPKKAQERYFQIVTDSDQIPVCFEDPVYTNQARNFALLEFDREKKQAKWTTYSHIDKKDLKHHDMSSDVCPKIDSMKSWKQELYAFSSGESQTSVNKWGMDYYALVKISSDGRIIEKLLESELLKALGKKTGVNGIFTDSPYLILSPLFKNDDWKGKQKLFSLATREWCDIALPRGMSKHKLQNMTDNFCLTFLYDRGLKELALCRID